MINKITGEAWKLLHFPGSKVLRKKYALSNTGRMASFLKKLFHDGKLLDGSLTTGYRTLNLHRPENNGTLYVHREIARLFLKKKSPKHRYVIHKNHNKLHNAVSNLKWATLEEMIAHQQKSPAKRAYKKIQATRNRGLKLTANQVASIKKLLNSKSRNLTIKKIAEKYGVSEMTLYRIKSGENWGRIKP